MNRATIIRLGIEAGMKPSEAQPAINAIGRTVPVVWLELFAALVEAEALKAHQQAIEAAVLAEREALARRADSIGHHWSGAPATAFFEFAEEIRSRTQNMRIPDTHK